MHHALLQRHSINLIGTLEVIFFFQPVRKLGCKHGQAALVVNTKHHVRLVLVATSRAREILARQIKEDATTRRWYGYYSLLFVHGTVL